MINKSNHKYNILKAMVLLLLTAAAIAMFASCTQSTPADVNDPSSQDPAAAGEPAYGSEQHGQQEESGPGGQDSEQPDSIRPPEEKAAPEPLALDDDLKLGQLQVDMPKELADRFIEAKLYDRKTDNSYGFESETLIYEDGTEIHLVDGKIYSISVADSRYPTPRGLKVGDTAEKVEELYGEPSAIEEDGLLLSTSR
jgi:hypothetical protein